MSTKLIEQVVELTNIERAKANLQPLKLNDKLSNAAEDHSNDMAQDNFFSHTGVDGSTVSDRVKNNGYEYSRVGENIAAGQTSAAEVVEGWMNSPGHRANILNPNYAEIGVGYEYLENDTGSSNYNQYWTQVFGTSMNNNKDRISDLDSVDSIEDSESSTSASENFVMNRDFEIGAPSLDQSLFIDDEVKSIDFNSNSMEDSTSSRDTFDADFMVERDRENISDRNFEIDNSSSDRSYSTDRDIKYLNSNLTNILENSANYSNMFDEDLVTKNDSLAYNESFSSSNDTEFSDSDTVDLISDKVEDLVSLVNNTFSENFY